jgi:hopene-associated glycosyltransferase HpnB
LQTVSFFLACLTLAIWVYLLAARGGFWRVGRFDADGDSGESAAWPSVTAIVPARNEAAFVGPAVASLLGQDYPGPLALVVVDDHSEDRTGEIARRAADELRAGDRVEVISARELPLGWTGKLWALSEGIAAGAAAAQPEFFWFTDADVVHAPDTLRRLVTRAQRDRLDLASLMVLLRCRTLAERALLPAFLFFFLKLYPPAWINDPLARNAGAAGGCILLRRAALQRIGGVAAIRGEVIDDCALARAVKNAGGRIWMGLTRLSESRREYPTFAAIERMIVRTAFAQLRYSLLLLAGTAAGLVVTYLAPVALLFSRVRAAQALGLAAWSLITPAFLPAVRFYRRSWLWALALPFVAAFYLVATADSACRYWLGHGAPWKGRAQAPLP